MSEQRNAVNSSATEFADEPKASVDRRRQRIDTEHRGVTGTLILTDTLDDKVCYLLKCI
jgi:hypothetical protein